MTKTKGKETCLCGKIFELRGAAGLIPVVVVVGEVAAEMASCFERFSFVVGVEVVRGQVAGLLFPVAHALEQALGISLFHLELDTFYCGCDIFFLVCNYSDPIN